jgi:hypothetical protein
MIRKWMVTGAGLLWIALAMASGAAKLHAAAAPQDAAAKPAYTLAEYNQYQAADKEANPQAKVKALDDFVKAYPNSSLMPYIYRDYYATYMQLKNFAQTIEYTDRMIALGDKIDATGRLEANYDRALAFFQGVGADKTLQTPDALTNARKAALAGLGTVDELKNPDPTKADQFEQQKKGVKALFNAVAALASANLKDYPAAAGYYKAVLAITPDDPVTHYRLGIVDLQMTPPAGTDGFWELARASN